MSKRAKEDTARAEPNTERIVFGIYLCDGGVSAEIEWTTLLRQGEGAAFGTQVNEAPLFPGGPWVQDEVYLGLTACERFLLQGPWDPERLRS